MSSPKPDGAALPQRARRLRWGADAFSAILPLGMGGLAIFLFQSDGYWSQMVEWVGEGTLMIPAALLCLGSLQNLGFAPVGRARSASERAVVIFLVVALLIFAASVQPGQRAYSDGQFALINAVAYVFVIALCVTLGRLHKWSEVEP